jgi:hypothetical protein
MFDFLGRTLNTVIKETRKSALQTAREEALSAVSGNVAIEILKSGVKQANVNVVEATRSAKAAHKAASEAEDNGKASETVHHLGTQVDAVQHLAAAINETGDLATNIAKIIQPQVDEKLAADTNTQLQKLSGTVSDIKNTYTFSAAGCPPGHESGGVLFALQDSNVPPRPSDSFTPPNTNPLNFSLSGNNAAGLTNHYW